MRCCYIIFCLLFLACSTSKPPAESLKKISAEGYDLQIGESKTYPDGNIVIKISEDSAFYYSKKPAAKEQKPFIHIQKVKDKSIDKSRENSDDLSVSTRSKAKTAKNVDKSKYKSKDKSKENSNNRHKEKGAGLPWWLWLILIFCIAYGLNKIFKWVPWL